MDRKSPTAHPQCFKTSQWCMKLSKHSSESARPLHSGTETDRVQGHAARAQRPCLRLAHTLRRNPAHLRQHPTRLASARGAHLPIDRIACNGTSASPREVIVGPVDEPPYCTDTRVEAARVPAAPVCHSPTDRLLRARLGACLLLCGRAHVTSDASCAIACARLPPPGRLLPTRGVFAECAGLLLPSPPFHSTRTPDSGAQSSPDVPDVHRDMPTRPPGTCPKSQWADGARAVPMSVVLSASIRPGMWPCTIELRTAHGPEVYLVIVQVHADTHVPHLAFDAIALIASLGHVRGSVDRLRS
ncbi:hypothetical protein B0H10DRAFT_2209280 [Mycena sp. CBHHK59/15]|nr:hypothetical protein B0H10DRAFT_2209280 [Mycena sp. CBHHK59/15]